MEGKIVKSSRGVGEFGTVAHVGRDDAARGREATERDRRPIAARQATRRAHRYHRFRHVRGGRGRPRGDALDVSGEARGAFSTHASGRSRLPARAIRGPTRSRRPALQLLVPARDALLSRARPPPVSRPVGQAVSRTLPLASRSPPRAARGGGFAVRAPLAAAGAGLEEDDPAVDSRAAGRRRASARRCRRRPTWRSPPRRRRPRVRLARRPPRARRRAPRRSRSVVPDASPASSTAAAPPAAVPDTLRGPYRVRRLPKLEHTCVSCFPRCVGDACLLSIDAYVPTPPPLPDAMFPRPARSRTSARRPRPRRPRSPGARTRSR